MWIRKKSHNVRIESFLSVLEGHSSLEALSQPLPGLHGLSQGQGPLLDLGKSVALRLQNVRTVNGQIVSDKFDLWNKINCFLEMFFFWFAPFGFLYFFFSV